MMIRLSRDDFHFGTDIVACGFVKDLDVDDISGETWKSIQEKKKMKWAHNADVSLKTVTLPILTSHYKFDGSEWREEWIGQASLNGGGNHSIYICLDEIMFNEKDILFCLNGKESMELPILNDGHQEVVMRGWKRETNAEDDVSVVPETMADDVNDQRWVRI
ncbi:hypothetical protein Tco_0727315 [Tanacetum coccineum]|uniref:Uncharacterized protein n=1 Tax=Tanacetum coccineum TaxID=301880 RepID=A0ABQ4YI15_9ASTR